MNVIHNNTSFRNLSAVALMAAALIMSSQSPAYDYQPNTIYAQANSAIYEIDVKKGTAIEVAAANSDISKLNDLAFDGTNMFGMSQHWEMMVLDTDANAMETIKQAESYALQFNGLEAYNGVLYGAERNSLLIINKATGAAQAVCSSCAGYGMYASEKITDLAFDDNGNLYATIEFPFYSDTYLGRIDPETGLIDELMGTTGVAGLDALTVKDGVIYAMSRVGNLYKLDKVTGLASEIASDVLQGVNGMDTSPTLPAALASTQEASASAESGAGSLHWLMIVSIVALSLRSVKRVFGNK